MSSDQEEKLKLVLSSIEENCHESSPHEDLRNICAALQNGQKLTGKFIASGKTNYSYQIYLENDPKGIRLFAKLCFPHALWSGEAKLHYDLDRINTEFQLMEYFSRTLAGNDNDNNVPIATPYLLLDVSKDMRLLVAQWAEADEQFASQFVEGQVDRRVITKLAKTMATINLTECFDRSLNQEMKQGLTVILDSMLSQVNKLFDKSDPNRRNNDKCILLLDRLGKDRIDTIFAARQKVDREKECLLHTDLQVLNILVEPKPPQPINSDDNSRFGKFGNFCLIDWEMAHWGPKGRDIGIFYCFPIATALFHAAQGHTSEATSIIDCLREHWEIYAQALKQDGNKSDRYLTETFRSGMGFCGLFSFMLFYLSGIMMDLIHKDGLSEEDIQEVMGLIGEMSLKFLEWSFMDDVAEAKLDLDGLVRLFYDTIEQSMAVLSSSR